MAGRINGHGMGKDMIEESKTSSVSHERNSISEQAYQYLRSLILAEKISAGDIFTERRLAEQINASRTPLRTAINRLEGEGLIERMANGSIIIRQVAVEELLEILLIRRILEGEAAAQSAQRVQPEVVSDMIAQTRTLLADPDIEFDPFWYYDDSFHLFVAKGSGKPLLANIIENLRNKARMCHITRMERNFEAQASEHLAVLEAIKAQDSEGARIAMINHLDQVRERLMKWLLQQ